MANGLLDMVGTIPLRGSKIPIEYLQKAQTPRYEQPYSVDDCDCTGGDCVCTDCNECGND